MRAVTISAAAGVGLVAFLMLYTPQQAQRGGKLYEQSCAACHGARGQGGTVPQGFGELAGRRVPPVVGNTALPGMQTAGELFGYVQRRMPLDAPGSLTDEQYLAVTAWLLEQNGVEPGGEPLTPERAGQVPLR